MNTLERIDATLSETCTCGCGTPITDASPSAWYASETCYDQAHGRTTRAVEWLRFCDVLLSEWQEDFVERLTANMEALATQVQRALIPVFDNLTVAFAKLGPLIDGDPSKTQRLKRMHQLYARRR